MKTYLDCWIHTAKTLLAQAVNGEAEFIESLPRPARSDTFGFVASLTGDHHGRFAVLLETEMFSAPLMGDSVDQRSAWGELFREIAEAAAGELHQRASQSCRVEAFEEMVGASQVSCAFELKVTGRSWMILVRDEVKTSPPAAPVKSGEVSASLHQETCASVTEENRNLDLLLDVELTATLRFGSRELPLEEILELGPGDVVQLDRQIADPVDLIVGDRIVARGEVVLVNGNFGLRVTEVAAPRRRLESIRCLF